MLFGYKCAKELKNDEQKTSSKKTTHAIIYSIKNISSLNLVKKFEPVGTKNFAKIKVNKPIQEAEKEIIDYVKENLGKITI